MNNVKIIIVMVCLIFFGMPSFGLTLEGGVSYTVETARKEAFEGVEYKIPVSTFAKHRKDPNYAENKRALADGQTDLGDRWIQRFSDGGYGLVYKNDRYRLYYYYSNGKLEMYEVRQSLDCPMKAYKYSTSGELLRVTFNLSPDESYIYKTNGKLDAHWIGDNAYDAKGKKCLSRFRL